MISTGVNFNWSREENCRGRWNYSARVGLATKSSLKKLWTGFGGDDERGRDWNLAFDMRTEEGGMRKGSRTQVSYWIPVPRQRQAGARDRKWACCGNFSGQSPDDFKELLRKIKVEIWILFLLEGSKFFDNLKKWSEYSLIHWNVQLFIATNCTVKLLCNQLE